ncbi:hypothetical protein FRC01_011750, partial [Tulasnella sp. 417]
LTDDDATNSSHYQTRLHYPLTGPRSYLIPSDTQRIYGEDILACFPALQNSDTKYTIVLDACESEPFLELEYTYDETGAHGPQTSSAPSRCEQAQLVVVSAARRGELANTVTVPGSEPTLTAYGFLTYFLLRRLSTILLAALGALPGAVSQQRMCEDDGTRNTSDTTAAHFDRIEETRCRKIQAFTEIAALTS